MSAKPDQLAMIAPDREWRIERLTKQQEGVLEWARLHGEVRTGELRRVHGYSQPTAALRKLEKRGLIEQVRRGRWRPVELPREVAV